MYLRDAYGKAECKLCLNLIQDNLYSNCIKQKEKHRKPVSSIIKLTVRFFYPTAAGYRKTRIRNRPMLLVLLHSVYVSLSKISIIARTKTRPLEKRGVPLFADAKVRTFPTPTKYFCNFFS